jgi:ElaB/YqjD/DUF883 family membrane-anchored ribosome-binding protein
MFATATSKENEIKNDVKAGASRVGNDIRQTANKVRSDLNQADLEGTLNKIGQQAHDYLDSATNEINDASDRLTSKIRSNPVQSAAIAAAVGFLFGLAFRR